MEPGREKIAHRSHLRAANLAANVPPTVVRLATPLHRQPGCISRHSARQNRPEWHYIINMTADVAKEKATPGQCYMVSRSDSLPANSAGASYQQKLTRQRKAPSQYTG